MNKKKGLLITKHQKEETWMLNRDAFFAVPFVARRVREEDAWAWIEVPARLFDADCQELLSEIANALPVYLYLLRYICRVPDAEWGRLGELYQAGNLATFRHQVVIAKELGIDVSTVIRHIATLRKYLFLRTERRYWQGDKRYHGERHGNFYYLGFWRQDSEGKRREYLFSYGAIGKWLNKRGD